jgi:hypothetical protein
MIEEGISSDIQEAGMRIVLLDKVRYIDHKMADGILDNIGRCCTGVGVLKIGI